MKRKKNHWHNLNKRRTILSETGQEINQTSVLKKVIHFKTGQNGD